MEEVAVSRSTYSPRCPAISRESINSTGRGAAIAAPPVYKLILSIPSLPTVLVTVPLSLVSLGRVRNLEAIVPIVEGAIVPQSPYQV